MNIRYAERNELEDVNKIRSQVNGVHVNGRPEIFRAGFRDELKKHVYDKFDADEHHRRMGIATALVDFCRAEAKKRGFGRIELDMWEFNKSALAFYENAGFRTYRRYMEINI